MTAPQVHRLHPDAAAQVDGDRHRHLAVGSDELVRLDPAAHRLSRRLRPGQPGGDRLVSDHRGGTDAERPERVVVVGVGQHHRDDRQRGHGSDRLAQQPPLLRRGAGVDQYGCLRADHESHVHLARAVGVGERHDADVHVVGHSSERAGSLGHVTRLALALSECQRSCRERRRTE